MCAAGENNVAEAVRNYVEQVQTAAGRAGPRALACSHKMTEVTGPPEERTANLWR